MANTKLNRTSGTPTSSKKFTISFWVKRNNLGSGGAGHIFDTYVDGTNRSQIGFDDDVIDFRLQVSGSNIGRLLTNRKFRDISAWYSIVASVDTTLGTADDRVKLYVNGVQETSFSNRINPSVNADFPMGGTHTIGAYGGGSNYFDGTLSHFHFVDGEAYPASTFGSVDATSGIWKINTSPSVTYGNNGFFILKDGNTITDQSGESNDFSLGGGTLTKTQDCPDNNFATWNPLVQQSSGFVLSNGNTTADNTNDTWRSVYSTLAPSVGKYYFECKIVNQLQTPRSIIGVCSTTQASNSSARLGYEGTNAYAYGSDGNKINNGTNTSYGNTFATGDIISCGLDLDNGKIYFGKNGTWQNSGDPTSGSTGTGSAFNVTLGESYYFGSASYGNEGIISINAGNGYFGTTAVTTNSGNGYAGTDGKSIFNYQPPTGYSALSTKGLNL